MLATACWYFLSATLVASGGSAKEVVSVRAEMPAAVLTLNQDLEFSVQFHVQEGWSTDENGLHPMVEIEVPASVELSGKVLESFDELKKNEFLRAPFERLLQKPQTSIGFRLTSPPAKDARIEFNFLAYVSKDPAENGWFVRKRLALPIVAGATAVEVSPRVSRAGASDTLQLGDEASSFELPEAEGDFVEFDQYLYERNIIVTTYRAFW